MYVDASEVVQTVDTSYRKDQHKDAAAACLPPGGRHHWPTQSESFLRDMVATASESEKNRLDRLETEKREKMAREEAEACAARELEERRAREEEAMRQLLEEQQQESQNAVIVVEDEDQDEVWLDDIKSTKQRKPRKPTGFGAKREPQVKRMKTEITDHLRPITNTSFIHSFIQLSWATRARERSAGASAQ